MYSKYKFSYIVHLRIVKDLIKLYIVAKSEKEVKDTKGIFKLINRKTHDKKKRKRQKDKQQLTKVNVEN